MSTSKPIEKSLMFDTYDEYTLTIKSFLKQIDFKTRNNIVSVKINENVTLELTESQYYVNLIILKPFIYFNISISDTNIMTDTTVKELDKHIDQNILQPLLDLDIDRYIVKKLIAEAIQELTTLAAKANTYIGSTINIYDIIHLSFRNKEFKKLLDYHIDPNEPVDTAEKKIKIALDRMLSILNSEDTCLKNFLHSGVGIKPKQLQETFLVEGFKTNMMGGVIPTPVNTSLIRGLRSASDLYIASETARKAAILIFGGTSKAGYLTRKFELLSLDTESIIYGDCGSETPLNIFVKNENILKTIVGKNIIGTDKHITMDDTDLIGTTVGVRSPITCAYKTKNKVCSKCFGNKKMYEVTKDYHVGIVSTLSTTEPFTQTILSTKHMSKINVNEIEWPDIIKNNFNIDNNTIIPNNNDFTITITNEDVARGREHMEIVSMTISLHNGDVEEEIVLPVKLTANIQFDTIEHEDIVITGDTLNKIVFTFIVHNQEISESLDMLLYLFDRKNDLLDGDFSTYYNNLLQLIELNGIDIVSSHVELLVSMMIRDSGDIYRDIDLSSPDITVDDYSILRLSEAIKTKSQFVGFSFEKLKKQLDDPRFYMNKKPSMIESLYE